MNPAVRRVAMVGAAALWAAAGAAASGAQEFSERPRQVPAYLEGEEARAARLYREVSPTVVTLFSHRQSLEEGEPSPEEAVGSGVLVSPDGHILTAAHVVQGAERVTAKTADGLYRLGDVLFSDTNADIAVVRLRTPAPGLRHAVLGDSDRLAVGQYAYAIGSPYGLERSFSAGRVSGFRDFGVLYDGTVRAEFIQTDAALNLGNSGGPVFNSRGEVIGVASRILSASGGFEGIGFVVAINTARQLLALENRVWLGIEVAYLDAEQIRRLLGVEADGGLLVQRVSTGSPADRAGLRGGSVPARAFGRDLLLGGDLIVEFAARRVCSSDCLLEAGRYLRGLDRIPVKFLRGGSLHEAVLDTAAAGRDFLEGLPAPGAGAGGR